MVRMNRKVGAIAIYSPMRVTLIALVVVAVLAGAGYALGRITDGDSAPDAAVVAKAEAREPTQRADSAELDRTKTDLTAAEARIERVLSRLHEERVKIRALKRSLKRARAGAGTTAASAGGATADRGSGALPLETPIVVTLRKGTGGADYTIGRRLTMSAGVSYRLCSSGPVGICTGGSR